jgi:hypothetical protein
MRRTTRRRWRTAAALGAVAAGGIAVQQIRTHARYGWGRATPYGKLFDPARLETIQGKVSLVARFVPLPGMSEGIELWLETTQGGLAVHLGPGKFIPIDVVDPGDLIEVTASRVELAGETVLMATSIQKGDLRIELRNEKGAPLWGRAR